MLSTLSAAENSGAKTVSISRMTVVTAAEITGFRHFPKGCSCKDRIPATPDLVVRANEKKWLDSEEGIEWKTTESGRDCTAQ